VLIGVPKEIKQDEYRVGLTPDSVRELVKQGHRVIVETDAGIETNFTDADYLASGAEIVASGADVYAQAGLVVKVKEPQPDECQQCREGQILFAYLHLAPDVSQAQLLQASGCTAIAYETVTNARGALPLLTPMSQVAGRLSVLAGAHCLEKQSGGRGVLLGGVPGVYPANVVVIGGGVVGTHAIRMAIGLEAQVYILDKNVDRLQQLDSQFGPKLHTLYATQTAIDEYISQADLIIGAVLIPGASAPKLIDRAMLAQLRQGAVLVDVAIDQGGCFATSRPTTHSDPSYVIDGIVHYCVANMPGAVPRTATVALNNVTLPFVSELARYGIGALHADPHLLNGLNVHRGRITHEAVAVALGQSYQPPLEALAV
jgi:alanine dehydrogenase